MSIGITEGPYTPEDLLQLPDLEGYELVNGYLVEHNVGWLATWVSGKLYRLLAFYGEDQAHLSWVVPPDAGYQCFPHAPKLVRKPDVSFISLVRLPADQLAEVVSPKATYDEVERPCSPAAAEGACTRATT